MPPNCSENRQPSHRMLMTLDTSLPPPTLAPGTGALARVYSNAGKLLGGKAAAGLIGLVYLSLAARTLGPGDYGVLVLISFYTMLVGGFGVLQGWHTIVRYGSAGGGIADPAAFKRLFAFTVRIELGSGLLAIVLSALMAHWAGRWFGWPQEIDGLAALYSLAIIANMHNTASGVLNLLDRIDLLSVQQVAGPMVRLLGAVIAWWADAGLSGFLLAWLLGAITEGLIDWWLVLRELSRRGLNTGLWHWPAGITREHPGIWKFLLTNNFDVSLTDAGNRITPLLVGAVLNPAAVGLYHLALRLGMVLQQPVLALGRTVYPELAQLAARNELRAIRQLVLRTGLIAMAAGLIVCLVFAVFGTPLLRLIGGPGFDDAYQLLLLIGLARTVHLFGFPFGSALVALGRPYLTLWINLAVTLGLLPVLYLLLQNSGLIGAGLHAMTYALASVGTLTWVLLTRATHTSRV